MTTIVSDLFGVYTPLMDATGVPVAGLAGVDWPWITGAVLFIVTLTCVFKIIGVVVKK